MLLLTDHSNPENTSYFLNVHYVRYGRYHVLNGRHAQLKYLLKIQPLLLLFFTCHTYSTIIRAFYLADTILFFLQKDGLICINIRFCRKWIKSDGKWKITSTLTSFLSRSVNTRFSIMILYLHCKYN